MAKIKSFFWTDREKQVQAYTLTTKILILNKHLKKIYTSYLGEDFSKFGINKRTSGTIRDENLKINTGKDRRKFKRQFKEKPIATKKSYFQKYHNIFFR